MTNRITIADVAREAGVSMMTVSRVINNKGDVSPATRQRVLQVIENLGYRPSGIARGLATQHTGTLGLVVPDIANPFFSEVARGVENIAHAHGYNVFLCNTNEDQDRELDVLNSLAEKWVDGIVLCSSRLDNDALSEVTQSHPAVVLVNRRLAVDAPGVSTVLADDLTGSRMATEHLIHTGHQGIGFLTGPPGSRSGQWRVQGYKGTMRDAGIPISPTWMQSCSPFAEHGCEVARVLLTTHPEITALLCYNDLVAVGALKACKENGFRVPEDVAVVGFDDIPLAALVTPSLTTCHIPRYDLGAKAVELLLKQITSFDNNSREVMLQPRLIIRSSAP
jgi:LacI family transcriptional regulator